MDAVEYGMYCSEQDVAQFRRQEHEAMLDLLDDWDDSDKQECEHMAAREAESAHEYEADWNYVWHNDDWA